MSSIPSWKLKLHKRGTWSKYLNNKFSTHLSLPDGPEAGLRLRNAFNHLVFIDDDDDVDILRSPPWTCGDVASNFAKKSSFCNEVKK